MSALIFEKIQTQRSNYFSLLHLILVAVISSCGNQTKLPDPLAAGWHGESVCKVLEENESIRSLKCTFPPGVGHERHFHSAHFGYTLKGSKFQITDTTGTREVNVPTNYSFYNDFIEWHEVLNIGEDTAIFLIIEPKNL